jgi:hypothetical protein
MRPQPVPELAAFIGIHLRLGCLFAVHQEMLLDRRVTEARAALAHYRDLLALHMRHEEEVLLPLYEQLGPDPARPSRLYTGQHRRMNALLDSAAERLAALESREPVLPPAIIDVLDLETTYKHLVEHHEDAELHGLFGVLGAKLDELEQARIVAPCLAEWHRTEESLFRNLAAASRCLDPRALGR